MIQLSVAVRNARLDAIEATIGPNAKLKIFSGTMPSNVAAANAGTVVSTIDLPADWMAAAAGGSKSMSGTWADNAADANGTAMHYRIYQSDGTTCHLQGTASLTGGGGDMTLDSVTFNAGQAFSITGFTLTDANE